ncbi:MAG: benzoate-CoA ligase family protein [Acidobacteria bacterium]|nr:benzoate-CoA ligase family protein [Acidobacteriota bacterium]
MSLALEAADLGIPQTFNVATHFVDRHVLEGRGTTVALECGDERVTYDHLFERVNRVGSALGARLGVRSEERVVLLLLDGPAFAYSFFGAIKIGAVPVPVNTLWKPADYRYVLNDSRARTLIVSHELLPQIECIARGELPHLEHVIVVGGPHDSFSTLVAGGAPHLEAAPTSRDEAAFWLYSSGSTGAPKGCVHLHHDMVVCAELFARRTLGVQPADRFFSVAKLFFAYGLGNALYFPLAVGGTSILWPGPPTAPNVFQIIERHRPTIFFSVPTNYAMLLSHPGTVDLSSLRLAVSAGEALPPALYDRFKDRFGIEILDGIGSTETLHMFIANRPGAVRPGSSGQLVSGYDARLLDDGDRPVAPGEIGNLWIKGDSVCAGYWNQHEKSKNTIEGHWIKTGDKFSRDADGFFWYAGRSDDMLKVGGLWVSPVEVENTLAEHPAVRECGVVAREDRDELVKPAAFVVLKPGVDGTPALADELQQHVRARLAEYKRPRWIEFLPELPKTATGKIQRFKLRELARLP